jgi:Zn-dependent protease/CBS domain-containing protein
MAAAHLRGQSRHAPAVACNPRPKKEVSLGSSFAIGRIAGIRISIHWSWLVVFALFVWTLSTGVFPRTNPDLGDGAHIAMAFVAAALFFVSVLLHELGHALQARREGVEIEGITLWLFGGVATLKGSFESGGAEFRIAIAGPIVSLVLAILFIGVALLESPQEIDGVVAWLGYVNLSLLVFNLIPAVPLDGGRVLHAALWHFRGDFAWSTRVASAIGRGFGFLLIGVGIAMFVVQGSFSGAWLVFLGWFLLAAASAEARYAAARQALGGLRVGDLMARNPVSVPPALTLGRFLDEIVWSRRFTTYPVVENGRAIGLLPFRCIAEVARTEWDVKRVRDCMLGLDKVPVFAPDDDALDAFATLSQDDLHRGLVLAGDRLVGLLSITDLATALEAPPRRPRSTPTIRHDAV